MIVDSLDAVFYLKMPQTTPTVAAAIKIVHYGGWSLPELASSTVVREFNLMKIDAGWPESRVAAGTYCLRFAREEEEIPNANIAPAVIVASAIAMSSYLQSDRLFLRSFMSGRGILCQEMDTRLDCRLRLYGMHIMHSWVGIGFKADRMVCHKVA